jgi:hypothetical protein
MKTQVLLLALLALLIGIAGQALCQTFTVSINQSDAWWQSRENFGSTFDAVIRDPSGNIVPNSGNFYTQRYL